MKGNSPQLGMLLPNRVALIIITATMVTGGFLLGYFVGKSTSVPQPSLLQVQVPSAQPLPSPVTQDTPPVSPLENPAPQQGTVRIITLPETKQQTVPEPKAVGNKEIAQNPSQSQAIRQKEVPVSSEQSPVTDESAGASLRKAPYSVQAGAFQKETEAETLQQKLKSKGYTTSIIKDNSSKGSPLFKVRIGDFETKKEAEVFALKVKMTEGLQSIVIRKK